MLDFVELRSDVNGWRAGDTGTVVEVFTETVLVEMSDEHDPDELSLVEVPASAVRAVPSSRTA
jgi:hypothetical protein